MNRAIENRLIKWLLRLELHSPEGRYYYTAAVVYLIAIVCLVAGFFAGSRFGSLLFAGLLLSFFGNHCYRVGKHMRDVRKTVEEQAARLAEQDERIRKLEAQLAALTPPTPTH